MSTSQFLADAKLADMVLQSGAVESAVLSIDMPEEDLATVVSAFDQYAVARVALADLTDHPERLIGALWIVQAEHARLVDAYRKVQAVVDEHWEAYAPFEQSRLMAWRDQAVRLEQRYASFIQSVHAMTGDARQQQMLQLVQTVAQIALIAGV